MRKAIPALFFAALLAAPVSLLAHQSRHHQVIGTITAVDANHIEVKTKDGKTASVPIGAETKYFIGKAKGSASGLKVGVRVVIAVDHDGNAYVHLPSSKAVGSKQK